MGATHIHKGDGGGGLPLEGTCKMDNLESQRTNCSGCFVQTQVASDWIQADYWGLQDPRRQRKQIQQIGQEVQSPSQALRRPRVPVQRRSKARSRDQTESRAGAASFPAWPALHTLAAPECENEAPRGESEDRAVKRQEAKHSRSHFLPVPPISSEPRRLQSAALNQPVNWV